MTPPGSVTTWLDRFKAGDPEAARALFVRFYQRTVSLARHQLHGTPRRDADEEDVANSAFHEFFQGAANGTFARLDNRKDLWVLLQVLVTRRVIDRRRRVGRVPATQQEGLESAPDPAPDPALAAAINDRVRHLLDLLGDDTLRAVALARLEGFPDDDIAARIGRSVRTVQRSVAVIKTLWSAEIAP